MFPPSVVSMTGFARAEGQSEGAAWTVEVKSVNSRNLDIRCRLPGGLESLEALIRTEVARRFKRGSLNVVVTLTRTTPTSQVRINRALLDQILALARELEGAEAPPPRLDVLLSVRGVIDVVDDGEPGLKDHLFRAVATDLTLALDRLSVARAQEGARLGEILDHQLDEITGLVRTASASAATQPQLLRERLRNQIASLVELLPPLPEERLAQEVALLVARGDVREELDRLRAHIAAARELLSTPDAIGRRLDFLCQEFNREANTLCSKSTDMELTRAGLALKATIEQLREQVQNIE